MTYTLFLSHIPFACFFTKEEADHYAFDLSLIHSSSRIAVLAN